MFSVWPIDRGSLGQAGNLLWVSSFKQWNIFNVSGRSTDGPFYEQVHETYLMCVADRPMVLFTDLYLNQWNVFHPCGRSTGDPLCGSTCFICVANRPMVPFMGPYVSFVWPIDRWSPLWVHMFHLCDRSTDGLFSMQALPVLFDGPIGYAMPMVQWAIQYIITSLCKKLLIWRLLRWILKEKYKLLINSK